MISTTEAKYFALYQAMRDVLPFLGLITEIEFVFELQGEAPKVLCSISEKPVTVHEDNQGEVVLVVALQMQPRTKRIAIKYHHCWSFIANGDVEIQHIDTKE